MTSVPDVLARDPARSSPARGGAELTVAGMAASRAASRSRRWRAAPPRRGALPLTANQRVDGSPEPIAVHDRKARAGSNAKTGDHDFGRDPPDP